MVLPGAAQRLFVNGAGGGARPQSRCSRRRGAGAPIPRRAGGCDEDMTSMHMANMMNGVKMKKTNKIFQVEKMTQSLSGSSP